MAGDNLRHGLTLVNRFRRIANAFRARVEAESGPVRDGERN